MNSCLSIKPLLALFILLACWTISFGQDQYNSEEKQLKLVAGTSVKAHLSFDISADYHIQTDHPDDDALIPTQLVIEPVPGLSTGQVRFLNEYMEYDFGAGNSQKVFSGELDVIVPITVNDNINRGEHKLKGSLIYQPCMDRQCLYPRNYEFIINVLVL